MNISVYDIIFKEGQRTNTIVVSGEVKNRTSKSYGTAVFHIILFGRRSRILGTGIFRINNFTSSSVKPFEVLIEKVYETVEGIAGCEVIFEGGY